MMSSQEGAEQDDKEATLEELPDSLIKLTLMIAKTFYGREHYIVVQYVQRNRCIKEEDLRQLIKFDSRYLRTILVQLKLDKIIKERQITEEVQGRCRRHNYYFINYAGMLNMAKYKIDHMRQRLELKDKEDVDKASYRCTGCGWIYEMIDMDKIFDAATQGLQCWRCKHTVESNEANGQAANLCTSVTKFNEQMAPFFLLIQNLDGIRLAKHLAEPPIRNAGIIPAKPEVKKLTTERSGHSSEKKEDQPDKWLTDLGATPYIDEINASIDEISRPDIESLLDAEFDKDGEESVVVRENVEVFVEQISTASDEELVYVDGKVYHLGEITVELMEKMTPSEKELYIRLTQESLDY